VNIIKVEVKPRIEAKTRVSNCIELTSDSANASSHANNIKLIQTGQ